MSIQDLIDYQNRTPELFAGTNPIIEVQSLSPAAGSGHFWIVSRNFYLFLAAKGEKSMWPLTAFQTVWSRQDGAVLFGQIENVSCISSNNCKCPLKGKCSHPFSADIKVDVISCAGAPTPKTSSLCLWHDNRTHFRFDISITPQHLVQRTTADVISALEVMKFDARQYNSGTSIKFAVTKGVSLAAEAKKKIYEANKNQERCVACGKATEERSLLITTIRYCSCID